MKILDKSIQIATQILPTAKFKSNHISLAFERNHLLAVGLNDYGMRAEVHRFGTKFGIQKMRKIPSLHAEISMVNRLWGRYYIDGRLKVVVLRLNRKGELLNSRPCRYCSELFLALGVTKVWHSTADGKIVEMIW